VLFHLPTPEMHLIFYMQALGDPPVLPLISRKLLDAGAGYAWAWIREKLDYRDSFIDRWNKRFRAERLAGLFSRHAGQLPTTLTPALEPFWGEA
jgi:hypothetical protein